MHDLESTSGKLFGIRVDIKRVLVPEANIKSTGGNISSEFLDWETESNLIMKISTTYDLDQGATENLNIVVKHPSCRPTYTASKYLNTKQYLCA